MGQVHEGKDVVGGPCCAFVHMAPQHAQHRSSQARMSSWQDTCWARTNDTSEMPDRCFDFSDIIYCLVF